jgi:hypothetical protein
MTNLMNFLAALFFIALAASFAVAYIDGRVARRRRVTELPDEERFQHAA